METSKTNKTDVQSAIEAGMALMAEVAGAVSGTPYVMVPPGAELKLLHDLRDRPIRAKVNREVTSPKSFIDYFNRFASPDSVILVDYEKRCFVGIIDYHERTEADNCDHRVTYQCPLTPEAKRWLDNSGKAMDQTAFANFIESGLPELHNPPAAEMLEVATTLIAKSSANFRSSLRLDNGQAQFAYEEEVQGSAGISGQLKIPTKIVLALVLFRGDNAAYPVEANFRYRVKDGKLTMWYELIRPHVYLEDAVRQIAETISAGINCGLMLDATT